MSEALAKQLMSLLVKKRYHERDSIPVAQLQTIAIEGGLDGVDFNTAVEFAVERGWLSEVLNGHTVVSQTGLDNGNA